MLMSETWRALCAGTVLLTDELDVFVDTVQFFCNLKQNLLAEIMIQGHEWT